MAEKSICSLTVTPIMLRAYSFVTKTPYSSNIASRSTFCTSSVPKQETAVTPVVSPTCPPHYAPSNQIALVQSQEELQDEWKSLEKRVANRKTKVNDGNSPTGRGKRSASAWDAENNEG